MNDSNFEYYSSLKIFLPMTIIFFIAFVVSVPFYFKGAEYAELFALPALVGFVYNAVLSVMTIREKKRREKEKEK